MKQTTETRIITENPLAVFLHALGFLVSLVDESGNFRFQITGLNLDRAIASYYENCPIPIQSYLLSFKAIRNMVAVAKTGGQR